MWGRSRRPAGDPPAPSPGRHGAAGREEAQVRQGVDAGARQRPLGPRGDPAGLSLARRVQAAGTRRAGPVVPPRARGGRPRRGARELDAGPARAARRLRADRRGRRAADGSRFPGSPSSRRTFASKPGSSPSRRRSPAAGSTLCCRTWPPICRASSRPIRRDRCTSANWRWNLLPNGCNPAAISSSRRSRARAFPEFQRAVQAVRQGLRAQAQVVARSQPGGLPGGQAAPRRLSRPLRRAGGRPGATAAPGC